MSRLREFWRSLEPEDEPLPHYQRVTVALGVTALLIVLFTIFVFVFNDDTPPISSPAAPTAAEAGVAAVETAVSPTATPLAPTATTEPTASPTVTPTATAVPTATPTPSPTVTPTATPSPTNTATPTLAATPDKIVATCVEDAAFFAGPGMRYEQIGTFVLQGEAVVVTAVSDNGYWMIVEKDGKRGWVTVSFFTVDYPLDTLPVVTEIIVVPTPTP